MRTTFIAALLPNATAKVQKNLHICKKISLSGLDSLDFLSRLTARTIFSYLAKSLELFFLPVGLGCNFS